MVTLSRLRRKGKTRSRLVAFPGYPYVFGTLLPNRRLGALAGALTAYGHETQVSDHGTVGGVAHLVGDGVGEALGALSGGGGGVFPLGQPLFGRPGAGALEGAYRESLGGYSEQIARLLVGEESLDFIVFDIPRVEDLISTCALAERICEAAPSVRLVASGDLAERFPEEIIRGTDVFDVVVGSEAALAVVAWAERLDAPEAWGSVPGLYFRTAAGVQVSREEAVLSSDWAVPPRYMAEQYPALVGDQKVRLFEVEYSQEACGGGSGEDGCGVEMKSPIAVCDEMGRVLDEFGAHAFHLRGVSSPGPHALAVARELLARGRTVWYSRCAEVGCEDAGLLGTLKASGAEVLSFEVDTGSQWLLDHYYDRDFGVSEMERALLASEAAGLYSVARFTYPAPADDGHTREETLRLIRRGRPSSAVIGGFDAGRDGGVLWGGAGANPEELLPPVLAQAVRNGRQLRKALGRRIHRVVQGRWGMGDLLGLFEAPGCGWAGRWRPSEARLRGELMAEIEELGADVGVTAPLALAALVSGHEGREGAFAETVRGALLRGDAPELSTLLSRFNQRACAPAHRVMTKPFMPLLEAVGN